MSTTTRDEILAGEQRAVDRAYGFYTAKLAELSGSSTATASATGKDGIANRAEAEARAAAYGGLGDEALVFARVDASEDPEETPGPGTSGAAACTTPRASWWSCRGRALWRRSGSRQGPRARVRWFCVGSSAAWSASSRVTSTRSPCRRPLPCPRSLLCPRSLPCPRPLPHPRSFPSPSSPPYRSPVGPPTTARGRDGHASCPGTHVDPHPRRCRTAAAAEGPSAGRLPAAGAPAVARRTDAGHRRDDPP